MTTTGRRRVRLRLSTKRRAEIESVLERLRESHQAASDALDEAERELEATRAYFAAKRAERQQI